MTAVPSVSGYNVAQRTLSQMSSEILRFVYGPNSDPELLAVAAAHVNDGIEKINMLNWERLQTVETKSFVADAADYTVETAYRMPLTLMLIDKDSRIAGRIPFLPPSTFDAKFQYEQIAGWPQAYTFYETNRMLTFDRAVSSGFVTEYPSFRVRGYRRIPKLDAAGDTIGAAPPEINSWLVWNGCAMMAGDVNTRKYTIAKNESNDRWELLTQDDAESVTDNGVNIAL